MANRRIVILASTVQASLSCCPALILQNPRSCASIAPSQPLKEKQHAHIIQPFIQKHPPAGSTAGPVPCPYDSDHNRARRRGTRGALSPPATARSWPWCCFGPGRRGKISPGCCAACCGPTIRLSSPSSPHTSSGTPILTLKCSRLDRSLAWAVVAMMAGLLVHGIVWEQFLNGLRFLTLVYVCLWTALATRAEKK